MRLNGLSVIVIGGGIAGLATARAFLRSGAQVTVLEQSAAFREVGAGLQLSPNGARVLDALGLGAALRSHALRSGAITLRKGASGAQVLRMTLPGDEPGFHLIHRADLVGLLQAALPGVIRLGARVQGVTLDSARPRVTLDGGEDLTADLVLGADGLHSVLRPLVTGQPEKPFFTGQVAWRALIPCAGDAPEAQVFMGPGRHLVSYPLRGGSLRNIVAVEERKTWAAEGWNHRDDPAHLRAAFAGFGGPVPGWLAQVQEVYLWGLFRHPVAATWYRGGAAILGDAAHPTLPFMAQGANMALEDAFALLRALERGATLAESLATWQAARRPRVSRVIEAANRNARNYHLRGPLAAVAHLALQAADRITPNAALRQYRWIYDFDVTA
ncbi:MAG: FAD-dependent oxidoreductase [Roseinatronobacter sp.]